MLIEIAGVSGEILCKCPENELFFKDYVSDKEPLFVVNPVEEDLQRIQASCDQMNEAAGFPRRQRSEVFLENSAIHAGLVEKLTEHDVILLHGSALCMDGEAVIFTASSGTGKSTHSRLWREMFGDRIWMINDDKPLLRIGEESTLVFGSPWDGKHHLSRNASAPLKAIVKLERAEVNHIEPIKKEEAFPVLMKQCFVSRNPATMLRTLDLMQRLLRMTDFYNLGCNQEPEAAKVAWEGIFNLYG